MEPDEVICNPTAEDTEATYNPTEEELARVGNAFTYHPLKVGQPARYVDIRRHALALAVHILKQCPRSREQSLALTKLEEAVMWANAAIARNE